MQRPDGELDVRTSKADGTGSQGQLQLSPIWFGDRELSAVNGGLRNFAAQHVATSRAVQPLEAPNPLPNKIRKIKVGTGSCTEAGGDYGDSRRRLGNDPQAFLQPRDGSHPLAVYSSRLVRQSRVCV
jgi:hypothetical protein